MATPPKGQASGAAAETPDPMLPISDSSAAIVSPLSIITVTTGDLDQTRRFYQGALGMTPDVQRITGPAAVALARHWGLEDTETIDLILFTRPGLPQAVTVRAIAVSPALPVSRPGYDAEYVGALGMGLPVKSLPPRNAMVEAMGFTSAVGITSMLFPRADQTSYSIGEVHWLAPDDILVLGVDRAHMRPVGPIDPAIDIGGPSYSSAMTADAEPLATFLAGVLGLEMRRQFTFQTKGPHEGMQLPPGTDVLFQQWFTPGASTGYLVIMHLLNAGKPAPARLGPARRGLSLWSFETDDLGRIAARARKAGAAIRSPETQLDLPDAGPVVAMIIDTPDGFPIEIYQKIIGKTQ